MNNTLSNTPNAILLGAPNNLNNNNPNNAGQIWYVDNNDIENNVKIRSGNRYEHFTPSSEHRLHNGSPLRVYNWTYRTYVAE